MRRLLYVPPVLVLALAALAVGADIAVQENPVPQHSFAVASIDVAAGDRVLWDIDPKPVKLEEVKADGKVSVHFNGPPGSSYSVVATVVNFKAEKLERYRQTVTIDGAKPQPNPDPKPQPDPQPKPQPDPAPIGTIKRFVVVEDSAKAGAWRGAVLGSPKVEAMYRAAGLSHRLIDVNADGDDATAAAYKQLAASKELPWLWLCDASGKVLKDLKCPQTDDAFVAAFDQHTGKRALGAILEKPRLKWAKFGESPKTPLIPRDQWKPVNLGTFLPPVHDQDGIGQCASSSACTVVEACRAQAGLPYVYLSAGDLYSRVNGGRDQGSMPEDNLNELITNGVAPAANVPYIWNGRRATDAATVAARKPYRIDEAYLCDSFEAMASALQQGFFIQEAIWWYDGDRTDADGWLPARGSGGRGGHALAGYALVVRNGVWGIQTRNSWGTSWGKGGDCVIPESRFSFEFGAVWACRSVYQTKSDFPAPKLARAPQLDVFADRFTLAP